MTSPFGSVYAQDGVVGKASFHFVHKKPFVSYKAAPQEWVLANGSMPPEKMYFENTSYDGGSKTFKGTINWTSPTQNVWKHEYTLVFDETFESVESGDVKNFDQEGTYINEWRFGIGQDYKYYRFGEVEAADLEDLEGADALRMVTQPEREPIDDLKENATNLMTAAVYEALIAQVQAAQEA